MTLRLPAFPYPSSLTLPPFYPPANTAPPGGEDRGVFILILGVGEEVVGYDAERLRDRIRLFDMGE